MDSITAATGAAAAPPGPALLAALLLLLGAAPLRAQVPDQHPRYDYPTSVRADYVIGCLAANGFKRELLEKCACEIDAIANRLPYEEYERAGTVLSMQQGAPGPAGELFRDTPVARDSLEKLRRAQAEATLRCS